MSQVIQTPEQQILFSIVPAKLTPLLMPYRESMKPPRSITIIDCSSFHLLAGFESRVVESPYLSGTLTNYRDQLLYSFDLCAYPELHPTAKSYLAPTRV